MASTALDYPPVLREGDRLTNTEFLRRWEAMPELKHAELIGGVVFMASPVGVAHGQWHARIIGWASAYCDGTEFCEAVAESTWVMASGDIPQPDAALRVLPEFGGQSKVARDLFHGAAELVAEVTGSSQSRDLGAKLDLYRRAGVREYLTILLNPERIVWRELVRGRYREIAPDADGLLRSRVFPGLWLDPKAVWDPRKPLRTAVERGLKSPEYAAFVKSLARTPTRRGRA